MDLRVLAETKGVRHPDEEGIATILPIMAMRCQRFHRCCVLRSPAARIVRVLTLDFGFTYNMRVRFRYLFLAILCVGLIRVAAAQDTSAPPSQPEEPAAQDSSPQSGQPVEQLPVDKSAPAPKDNRANPPRSDNVPAGESSSKQTAIDVSPPANDAKTHPEADLVGNSDVDEFTPYDPMKAMKCIEVGDWYYKQQNYKAAISRYREALDWKPQDAEATYKLAQVLNKTGDINGARENYEAYLKTLPNGPYARKAKEALGKLKEQPEGNAGKP
jgi:tetratricopeptide (TPR) repeat protein